MSDSVPEWSTHMLEKQESEGCISQLEQSGILRMLQSSARGPFHHTCSNVLSKLFLLPVTLESNQL